MVGERGGGFASFKDAAELMETHKELWSATIRQGILEVLEAHDTFHAADLLPLRIPADCKNIVGAQTNALVRRGFMAETGERRATSNPAGHGRRSAVYRITDLGITKLRRECKSPAGEGIGVSHKVLGPLETVARGRSSEPANASQRQAVAPTSGEGAKAPQGGGTTSSVATARPTLFDLEVPVGSHYGQDAA